MPSSRRRSQSAYSLFSWVLIAASAALAAPKSMGSESAKGGSSVSSAPRSALDSASVRKYYMDGDFDPAIVIIEDGLKSGRPFSHTDSVFAFKHLGVMYAARYETREKGKYYMHQLLMTEPTARIMDMYASDMIYMIFKNIQDEFHAKRTEAPPQRLQASDQGSDRPSRRHPEEEPRRQPEARRINYYWIGATGLLMAAGVGVYLILASDPESKTQNHPIE